MLPIIHFNNGIGFWALTCGVPGLLSGSVGDWEMVLSFRPHWLGWDREPHVTRFVSPRGWRHTRSIVGVEEETVDFAWQSFARLQRGRDTGDKSWRSGISFIGGCGAGTCHRGRALCSHTLVNWCGQPSASITGGLELIVNPGRVSLSLCHFFKTNGVFKSFIWFFSSLGRSGRLFYFPLINCLFQVVVIIYRISPKPPSSYIALTKLSFSFSAFCDSLQPIGNIWNTSRQWCFSVFYRRICCHGPLSELAGRATGLVLSWSPCAGLRTSPSCTVHSVYVTPSPQGTDRASFVTCFFRASLSQGCFSFVFFPLKSEKI